MKTKNLLVFFLAIVGFLLVVTTVSAATSELATIDSVKINDIGSESVSVIAGESVTIEVYFTALESVSDVKIKVELNGEKIDVSNTIGPFDVIEGKKYKKTLTVKVPYELEDEVSEDVTINVKVWNGDYKTENSEITLSVQRPTYNADFMSVNMAQEITAGELVPVEIVLKNNGYNNLDDVYVTLKITSLGVEKTSYFGDLVAVETNHDDDTTSGKMYLQVPYDAKAGVYTLEVEAKNSDLVVSGAKQIAINNAFSSNAIVASAKQSAGVGEKVDYSITLVNPTDKLKVYRVVVQSTSDVEASTATEVVAVPAGLSKSVTVTAEAKSQGEHTFNVDVFSGEELESTTALGLNANGSGIVAALTVVLAIIFVVLLVVLFVVLRKKPQKSDDFGESYY